MTKVTYEFDTVEDRDDLKTHQAVDRMYFALDHIHFMADNELGQDNEDLSDRLKNLLERIREEAHLVHELAGE